MMFLLPNALFIFAIALLPRSKLLLISWLQSPSTVVLEDNSRTSWPCWTLGSTGLTNGSSLSSTSTMLEGWPVVYVSRESEVWIFTYNLLILMIATNFFPGEKKNSGNTISTMMCWNQPSVSAGFYFWPKLGSAVGTERNLIQVGWFTKILNAY